MARAVMHPGLVWLTLIVGATWLGMVLLRLWFALLFVDGFPAAPPAGFVSQFVLGLRFDIATLPVLTAPALIVWPLLPYFRSLPRLLQPVLRAIAYASYPLVTWGLLSIAAGIASYRINQKLPGWEYYAYINDLPVLINSVGVENPWLLFAAVVFGVALPTLGLRLTFGRASLFSQLTAAGPTGSRKISVRDYALVLVQLALTFAIVIVALRGGWQESPLRAPDSLRTPDAALNTLPLNTAYTALQDFSDRGEFRTLVDPDKNVRTVQELLGRPADFPSKEYPLLRTMPPKRPFGLKRPNIVLVILESFTAAFLGPYGGDPQIAPEFNRLSKNGIIFRRFFSAGGRSANGIFAMLGGIPDRAGRTILRSPQMSIRLGGIGRLLHAKGYETFFYHGGDLLFDNLDRALPHFGFREAIGSRELDRSGCCRMKNAWGYDDSETMAQFLARMNKSRGPFFGVVFTLNTHHPFSVPAGFRRPFSGHPQADFLNAFHYTDHVLGDFIRSAEKQAQFANTVFLITGDHAHHTGLDYLDDRMVPLLIYMPGRIAAAVRDDVASQLDLLPTILALSGGQSNYAAMGRDLTAPINSEPFAFFAGGSGTNVIGWIEGDRAFSEWLSGSVRGLYVSKRPLTMINLEKSEPETATRLRERTLHFHQFARTLERDNRVWPPEQ